MIASISDSVPKLKLVSRVFLDYLALTKPRVMSLLLFTAVGGAFVAARGIPPWQYILPLLIGGALASGGASALNMWYEEDIDQEMHRTDHRPVAGGRIKPMNALIFGILLNAASFAVLYLLHERFGSGVGIGRFGTLRGSLHCGLKAFDGTEHRGWRCRGCDAAVGGLCVDPRSFGP